MTPLLVMLARSPSLGAAAVLTRGRLVNAAALIVVATAVAAVNAARFIGDVPVSSILYGPERSPAVGALLDALGRDRTAVVAYLIEQSWTAVVVVTAFSPMLLWILGSSAVHSAARLDGKRARYLPMVVLFAYATALTRIPADAAAALLGNGRGLGPQVAQLIGSAGLIWLAVIAWRAIEAHYAIPPRRALVVLLVAIVVFYVVPLALIVIAAVAILVAAVLLDYVPGL
ncbi:MAG TPA: YIP1 family protein [Candidatus Limnocylindria bacterium]|nr:YIP1 family protein [Candidatus Limnocylindria bacterium]